LEKTFPFSNRFWPAFRGYGAVCSLAIHASVHEAFGDMSAVTASFTSPKKLPPHAHQMF
jgi:hypothetical protein